jgi:hypothetical protein
MKLHRFNPRLARFKLKLREHKEKYIKIGTLIISVFILVIGILYFAYAKFSTVNKFNVTQTSVGTFNQGDYHLIAYINGVRSETIPTKTDGYVVQNVSCDNSATGTWDNNNWTITIGNATKSITKCSVYFVSKYKDASGASYPELYQGLIPIKYVDGNPTVADITQDWYNYANHNWANAVLVNCADTSIKNKYFDTNMNLKYSIVGTTIIESDILQYYVWIPRYKYLLWNAENGSSNEQAISITFEDKTATKSAGSTNGTWLTHPAFTFGSTELNGIWVGKFENSGSTTNLTIKPNVVSIVNLTVGDMFNSVRNVENSYASTYGVNSNEIDTHMMKNMEWGAVAYLSSSIYGRYTNSTTCIASGCEVWINNTHTGTGCQSPYTVDLCGGTITGCSGDSVSADVVNSMSACASGYDWPTLGVNASTTGNQYGIYDMSGGTWEYVMGNMVDTSGNFYSSSAGFSTVLDSKYYDSYTNQSDINTYVDHARGKLGDATKETLKTFGSETGEWNSDYAELPSGVYSWFGRGGYAGGQSNAGLFDFERGTGEAYSIGSFRSVLSAQ